MPTFLIAQQQKWWGLLVALPVTACIIGLRVLMWHYDAGQWLPVTPCTFMVTITVFICSQLMSGVLSDYKESEKVPSEIEGALETLL